MSLRFVLLHLPTLSRIGSCGSYRFSSVSSEAPCPGRRQHPLELVPQDLVVKGVQLHGSVSASPNEGWVRAPDLQVHIRGGVCDVIISALIRVQRTSRSVRHPSCKSFLPTSRHFGRSPRCGIAIFTAFEVLREVRGVRPENHGKVILTDEDFVFRGQD